MVEKEQVQCLAGALADWDALFSSMNVAELAEALVQLVERHQRLHQERGPVRHELSDACPECGGHEWYCVREMDEWTADLLATIAGLKEEVRARAHAYQRLLRRLRAVGKALEGGGGRDGSTPA